MLSRIQNFSFEELDVNRLKCGARLTPGTGGDACFPVACTERPETSKFLLKIYGLNT